MSDKISIDDLRATIEFCPTSGKLFWKRRAAKRTCRYFGKEAFTYTHKSGYKVGTFQGVSVKAHRVIWAIVNGEWPDQIDHINGIKTDNRVCNLRSVSIAENMKNKPRRKDNKSGINGVTWDKKNQKWLVQIAQTNRISKFVGLFTCIDQAKAARESAERDQGYHENHGRDARSNRKALSKQAQEKRK